MLLKASSHPPTPPLLPSVYEGRLSYSELWKQYQQSFPSDASTVIRDLAFCNDQTGTRPLYLMACTESGEVCIWNMPSCSDNDNDDYDNDFDDYDNNNYDNNDNDNNDYDNDSMHISVEPKTSNKHPICRFSVTNGPLYSIQIMDEMDEQQGTRYEFVMVAGAGGVWLYDWIKDIEPMLFKDNMTTTTTNKAKNVQKLSPLSHFPLHPSPGGSPPVPVYETCLCSSFLYGAAGDAFGCYKWDLTAEQLVTTYTNKGEDSSKMRSGSSCSLETVKIIPNSDLLLTGGEDGVLGIWDTKKDCAVEHLDLRKVLPQSSQTTTQSSLSSTSSRRSKTECCYDISSIAARDENWWVLAGGKKGSTSGSSSSSSSSYNKTASAASSSCATGFVSTWHGPTRSVVACVERRERPQKLAYSKTRDTLLSVGNESFVTQFEDPLSLATEPQRIRCDPLSTYAVEVAADGRMAVAGVGSAINIYRDGTLLVETLRL